ncbi:adhesion G protein-coupled receptor L4 [Pocillopora verrucosa]|uniref:adhesion G protein-coupled receptor L4 n=1 Tax=Pocillopora verrucosa TaxID=203993 RepID=UPI0033412E88
MTGFLFLTKTLSTTIVMLVVYYGQTSSNQADCQDKWTLNDSSCYYVYTAVDRKLGFWNAVRWCRQRNGSLTSVLSDKENDFLHHLINNTNLRPKETFYIGLHRNCKSNLMGWVDKQPYNYTNWYHSQDPACYDEGSKNETGRRCAYYNHVHKWQIDYCKTVRLFICKRPKKVEEQPSPTSGVRNTNVSEHSQSSTSETSTETSTLQLNVQDTLKKLDEALKSLEGVSLNQSTAERNLKELGTVLDSVVNPVGKAQPSLSLDQISQVVQMSEKIGELLVRGLMRGEGGVTEPKSIQINTESLVLAVDMLPPVSSENSAEAVSFPKDAEQTNNINLPSSLIWRAQDQDGVSIVSLLLSDISVTADPQARKVMDSGIMSSTILFNNGSRFNNLSHPVVINLSAVSKVNTDGVRKCVYLDVTTDPPVWSSSGCVVYEVSSSHTVCHCYHMTSFAVLMDVHGAYEGDTISEEHKTILSIVSIVGCLIALVCYIILLFAFFFLRRRTETLNIHINLAAAEVFAIFFFLIAYPGARIKAVCYAFAVLLHYFQLAAFFWMMVEGINLLRGMVKVFRVTSKVRTYFLFAWGAPAVVVAVTASISRHQYVRDNFCWISHQVIWSFAGPVAFILLVNVIALIVAIKTVVQRARYKERSPKMSALELEMRAAFKTLVILVPLLGVTWLLGFISIHNTSLVFQYLFAVLNSMQGLYFLIAQYWFDDEIKKNAHRASNRVKRLFSLTGTRSSSPWTVPYNVDKEQRGNRSDMKNQRQRPPHQDINHQQLDYNQNKNLKQQQEQKQTTNKEHFDAFTHKQQHSDKDFPNDKKETVGKMEEKEHSTDTYL